MNGKFTAALGKFLFMAAWPFWFVYFRVTVRTRVLIICNDELLVVKGWLGGQKWSLPGGGLHRNELPVQGAVREVREETGIRLKATQLRSLGRSSITQNGITIQYHCFYVIITQKPPLNRQRMEISEIKWIKRDALGIKNAELDTLDVLQIWQSTPVSVTI